jgi:predicted secreted Zn-dependent protease
MIPKMKTTCLRLFLVTFIVTILHAASMTHAAQPTAAYPYKIVYFVVRGKNTEAIARDVSKNGPLSNGEVVWAKTDYRFDTRWNTVRSREGYRATAVRVITTMKIFLPKWKNYQLADACKKKAWDNLVDALLRHELGHINLSAGLDKDIERGISALGMYASASELEKNAEMVRKKAMEENAVKQIKYDADTEHGAKDPAFEVKLTKCE